MEQSHKISLWTAVLMNINVMVGIGIYVLPVFMAKDAGYASFLGWAAVALVVTPIVVSIAKLAGLFPGAGGFYRYSKEIIGPDAGFISGFGYYFAYTGVAAFMTIALRDTVILPYVPMPSVLFNLLFVVFISLISLLGMKTIARIQNAGTIFKILPLIFVLAIFIAYWNPAFVITLADMKRVPALVPAALFGYWGFESCGSISHMIKGGQKNASKAMLIAFGFVMFLYSMFHIGVLHIMGAKNLAAAGSAREFVYFLGLSPYLQAFITSTISIMIALVFINAVFSIFTATSSVLQTMGKEKILPGSTHIAKQNQNQRPWFAIIIQAILIFAITTATDNKLFMVAMVNLGIMAAFGLALTALFLYQKRRGQTKQLILTVVAGMCWVALAYFCWMDIGPNNMTRLIGALPLIIVFVVSYGMYLYQKKSLAGGLNPPVAG